MLLGCTSLQSRDFESEAVSCCLIALDEYLLPEFEQSLLSLGKAFRSQRHRISSPAA